MTRNFILQEMKEIERINHCPFQTFYMRHTCHNGGITSNHWGGMEKFEKALQEVENSDECLQGDLPISMLVLVNDKCVHVWTKNPLWDCVNDPEEDSHVYTNVPLINKNGWFVDPKEWL